MIPFIILAIAAGLLAWVFVTLRAANRDAAPRQGDDLNVVHTGREVLRVVAIVVAVILVLLLIIFGTCISTTRWN